MNDHRPTSDISFTLTIAPYGYPLFFFNGLLLKKGEFTLSGTTVTFLGTGEPLATCAALPSPTKHYYSITDLLLDNGWTIDEKMGLFAKWGNTIPFSELDGYDVDSFRKKAEAKGWITKQGA